MSACNLHMTASQEFFGAAATSAASADWQGCALCVWHSRLLASVFLCIAGHSTFKFQHFLAILGYSPGLVRCVNAWDLLRWKLGGFHTLARRYPEPHTEEQLRQSQFRPRRWRWNKQHDCCRQSVSLWIGCGFAQKTAFLIGETMGKWWSASKFMQILGYPVFRQPPVTVYLCCHVTLWSFMHGQGRRAYVPFVDKVLLMGKAVSTKFASCVLMVALGWVDKEQDGNLFEACRTIFNILLPSLNLYPCVRCCSNVVFPFISPDSGVTFLECEGLRPHHHPQKPGRLGSSARNLKRLVDFGAKRWILWSLEYCFCSDWRWKKYCVLFTEYVNLCMSHTMYSYLLNVSEFEHLAF